MNRIELYQNIPYDEPNPQYQTNSNRSELNSNSFKYQPQYQQQPQLQMQQHQATNQMGRHVPLPSHLNMSHSQPTLGPVVQTQIPMQNQPQLQPQPQQLPQTPMTQKPSPRGSDEPQEVRHHLSTNHVHHPHFTGYDISCKPRFRAIFIFLT